MYTPLFVLALCMLIGLCQSEGTLSAFIFDYYKAKNIHQIIIFGCWQSAVDILRNAMSLDALISHIPITKDLDLKNILRVNYYHVGVVLDFDCPLSTHVLEQFSNLLVFNESYHWLMITASILPTTILESLKLTVESELTLATRNNDEFILYDVYNPSYRHGGKLNITYRGQWQLRGGLKDEFTQFKYKRRSDLNQIQLNLSLTLMNQPKTSLESYMESQENKHLDTVVRSHWCIMQALRDMYNFTIKLHQTNSWGYKVNGTFDGIIGDMVAGRIDISATPLNYKLERIEAVEFLVDTWLVDIAIIFRHPKSSGLRNNFLKPFPDELWWVILVFSSVYWILLFLSLNIEWNYEADREDNQLPISETGLITLAALAQQGFSDDPKMISGRIIYLSVFVWGLLLFQFYSASIVGSLLTPPPRWIKTLKDLTESSLDVGAHNVSYLHDLYKTTEDLTNREYYNRKLKPSKKRPEGGFYPVAEGIRRMKDGGFAFDMDTSISYRMIQSTFTEDEICELEEVRIVKGRKVAITTSKRSPFRKMVSHGVRKMVESGLTRHMRQIWHPSRPQCPENFNTKPTPVGMKEFSPAIFLLFFGVGISIAIMILEYIYYYYVDKKRLITLRRSDSVEVASETLEKE